MSDNRIIECPGCGAKITSNKMICDYCGSEIKVSETKKENTGVASETQSDQQPKPQPVSQSYSKPVYNKTGQKTISSLAIVSFILSLVGIGPVAFILGIIANARISHPDSNLTGRGFATAAIILSVIQVLSLTIILIVTHH